jgi:HEAT repeat protein
MTEPVLRFAKALAAVALFNGLLSLSVSGELWAADKEAEARKYTDDLRKAKDAKAKVTALQELGKLGQIMKSLVEPAIPDVYKALEDKDASVRAAAAYCLGLCDQPPDKAVPALTKLLKEDKEDSVKIGAAKGLAAMGPSAKDALPDLRSVFKSADKKSALAKNAQGAIKSIAGKNK